MSHLFVACHIWHSLMYAENLLLSVAFNDSNLVQEPCNGTKCEDIFEDLKIVSSNRKISLFIAIFSFSTAHDFAIPDAPK